MTPKQNILKLMSDLPENATIEDAMERLYFMSKIEKGLEEVRAGKVVTNEDVMKRIDACLK